MALGTIPVKDGSNASQVAIVAVDGSGHIAAAHVIVDAAGNDLSAYQTSTGLIADAAWVSGTGSVISILKGIFGKVGTGILAAGSAIIGKVGIDQTTPGTTNRVAANLDQVAGSSISQGHGTAATAIRVELPTDGTGVLGLNAGEAHVGAIGGKLADISTSFTRQANVTPYTAGQIVNDNSANPLDFATAVRVSGGSALLLSSRLTINTASIAGVQFRLYLFKSTPGTTTDAASYSTLWANRDITLGWVDFLNPISSGSPDATSYDGVNSAGLAMPLIATASDIYGVLVALTAYTPESGKGFNIHLRVDQN